MNQDKVNQDKMNQDSINQDKVIYDGLIALIKLDNKWKILNDFPDRFEITEKFVFEELDIDVNDENQFNWFKLNHPQIFKILLNRLLQQDPPPSKEKLTEIFIHLCQRYFDRKYSPDLEVLQSLLDKGVDIKTCGEKVINTSNLILFEFILKSGYKPNEYDIKYIIGKSYGDKKEEFMFILSKHCDETMIKHIQDKFCSASKYYYEDYDKFSSKLIQEYQKSLKEANKNIYYAVKIDSVEEPKTNFPNIIKVQKDNSWYLGYPLEEFTDDLDDKKVVLSQIGKPGFYML